MNIPWKRWSITLLAGLVTIGVIVFIKSQLTDKLGPTSIIISAIFVGVGLVEGAIQSVFAVSPHHPGTQPRTLQPIVIGRIDASLVSLLILGIVVACIYPGPLYISSNPPVPSKPTPIVISTPTPSPIGDPVKAMKLYHKYIEGEMPSWSDNMDSENDTNKWSSFQMSPGGCGFVNGSYRVYSHEQGFVSMCFASKLAGINNIPYPSTNFAYQVLMTLNGGDGGGIIFRASSAKYDAAMYRLDIRPQQQIFDILIQQNNAQRHNPACDSAGGQYCFNAAIYVKEKNELTVIAQDHDLYFFANGKFLEEFTDTTISSGYIGVFAVDKDIPTDVAFDSAQLWNLS